jgi:glycine/D-amino acid oxidase-like deaminating enzyme/nitrite reductase/ring-hydroxylating ferredoxin subunit
MKRDGACRSIWQSGRREYTPVSEHVQDRVYDVAIAGGGITGITTAYLLQKSGKECIVLEAQNLCFGTTGGTTAHLNNFFDATYAQVEKKFDRESASLLRKAADEALALYKHHIGTLRIACEYREANGFLFAQNEKESEELQEIYEASLRAGASVDLVNDIPVPIPFVKAIAYRQQGQLDPIPYVYALAAAFEESGGIIREHCAVKDHHPGTILEIETTGGIIKARNLIYATHIPPGVNLLHFRCAPYRSYVIAARLQDEKYPESPAYDMIDPYHYYRNQLVNGEPFLIAGGEDHKTGHEQDTNAPFLRLEAYLRKYFNIREISYRWSSQYFDPADGLAYIGPLPGNSDQVFVATGFGGNGMTYSHIAASLLTGLLNGHSNSYQKLLSPERVKPVAGFASFVKEGADVVAEFVSGRFQMDKLPELAQLAPEEGKVAKYEKKSLAIFKNEAGEIFALDPVCTHAKCIVTWNGAEKSWDCPCHGTRYNIKGEVLTGPASSNLERMKPDAGVAL